MTNLESAVANCRRPTDIGASAAAIEIDRLEVQAGGKRILSVEYLSFELGEWVGVVGPNGSGKTTLLQTISRGSGNSGHIIFSLGPDHREPLKGRHSRSSFRARHIALIPQHPSWPVGMKVLDYIMLGRTPYIGYLGYESEADLVVVRHWMQELEVDQMANRYLESLSGGEQQRVLLARALCQETPLLLLDEPTSSLDVGNSMQVMGLLDSLRWREKKTLISAVHDLNLAAQFCDQLVLLNQGRVVAWGSPTEILTEQNLRQIYGVSTSVTVDDQGRMSVIPLRPDPPIFQFKTPEFEEGIEAETGTRREPFLSEVAT